MTKPPLGPKHIGMRVDYSGMLTQAGRSKSQWSKFMLEELARNLKEVGRRYYAGDIAAVDEFLQLYCVEPDAREAAAKATEAAA